MEALDLENMERDDDLDEEEGEEEGKDDFNPDEDVVIVDNDDFVVRACCGCVCVGAPAHSSGSTLSNSSTCHGDPS